MWVKFGIRAMHIMLLSSREVHKNMSRTGHAVLMDINDIAFASVP
jgi:hypothetical protein